MKGGRVVLKWIAAMPVACLVLSLLFAPVYTMPVHIPNERGGTDYVWKPASFWCIATEGCAFGRHDAEGFNNLTPVDHPDILVLGSSHMEAHNVMQSENLCTLLDEKLAGEFRVFNMGMSGHTLDKICGYIPEAVSAFSEKPQVVVLETETCRIDMETVRAIEEGTLEVTPSRHEGILAALQMSPFFRQMYKQLIGGLYDQLLQKNRPQLPKAARAPETESAETAPDPEPCKRLLSYLQNIQETCGVQIVLFYHPQAAFSRDGSVRFYPEQESALFAEHAAAYGIVFLDAADRFEELYANEKKVPHGFSNHAIGWGHLNPDGHRVLAEMLYTQMCDMIEDGRLCR